ncbi:MAG: hypothetical protein EOP65_17080, partial [Sphingomonas sp.]
ALSEGFGYPAQAKLFHQTLGTFGSIHCRVTDFDMRERFWALGPLSAALAIFDGGARRARVRISRAQYDEAAASYRSTVLTAFREVEDDLARSRALVDQERDQLAATRAAERTRDLALIRYRDGASDYLDVVTAQTAALDAQRLLLEVQSTRLQIAVDTVRAIGGGIAT